MTRLPLFLALACGAPGGECLVPTEPPPSPPVNVCARRPNLCETCGVRYDLPDAGSSEPKPR